MYCKDIISSEMAEWQENSTVFIEAPTGSGKTTFILKALLPMALATKREILYLSNRQLLHKQLIKETCKLFDIPYHVMKDEKIAEFPGITFMTYQTLQEGLNSNIALNRNPFYFYVVADEVHYLLEDSAFNPRIAKLLEWLPIMRKKIFIAISATMSSALKYLGYYDGGWQKAVEEEFRTIYWREPRTIENKIFRMPELLYFYQIQAEMPYYDIVVYQNIEDIVEEINDDTSGDKWLIFQANKEQANKKLIKNVNKPCLFLSADNKNEVAIQEIIENQQFSEEVLVTTKVLDNGISLHDPKIKKIVLDTIRKTEFLQMLGRRRNCSEEEGTITLYLPQKSAKFFYWLLHDHILPSLKVTKIPSRKLIDEMMKSEEIYSIVRKFYDVDDGQLLLNPLARDMLIEEKEFCERMLLALDKDENFFVLEQLSWLGLEMEEGRILYLNQQKKKKTEEGMMKYLTSHEGKRMSKQEQQSFREVIGNYFHIILPEQFASSSRLPGLKRINDGFSHLKMSWEIRAISGKKKGEETVWILQQKILQCPAI